MSDNAQMSTNTVFDKLLKERIIWLGEQVDDEIANKLCGQMLLLAAEDPEADISLYINSPGGSVTAGMAITTPCSLFRATWLPTAWAWQLPWVSSCSPQVLRASVTHCRTPAL